MSGEPVMCHRELPSWERSQSVVDVIAVGVDRKVLDFLPPMREPPVAPDVRVKPGRLWRSSRALVGRIGGSHASVRWQKYLDNLL